MVKEKECKHNWKYVQEQQGVIISAKPFYYCTKCRKEEEVRVRSK